MSEEIKKFNWSGEQKIILDSTGSQVVSASAGSGKTRVMVQRVIDLVVAGTPLSDILAVTFGNAAAEELRERVTTALYDAARTAAGADRKRLIEEIDAVGLAAIKTLHAFALDVLREHFEPAGFAASFELLNDGEREMLSEKALTDCFEVRHAAGDAEFAELLEVFGGRKEEPLKKLIKDLDGQADIQYDKEAFLTGLIDGNAGDAEESSAAKCVLDYARGAAAEFAEEAADLLPLVAEEDVLFSVPLNSAIRLCTEIMRSSSIKELSAALNAVKYDKPSLAGKRIKSGDEVVKERHKNFREGFAAFSDELLFSFADYGAVVTAHAQGARYTKKLAELTRDYGERYTKLKAAAAKADFNDLEHGLAYLLASDSETVLKKYTHIFVDEYQDINPIQDFIVSALESGAESFLVGDLKQSIYGFRLANPEIFKKRQDIAAKDSKLRHMNRNFRSERGILNFVNKVFDAVMTEKTCGIDYKTFGRFGDADGADYKEYVGVDLFEKPRRVKAENTAVYSVRKDAGRGEADCPEGRYIAAKILELKERAFSSKGERLKFGDFAVLLRSRNQSAERVLEALRAAGIPFDDGVLKSGRGREEEEIINLLRAVSDPHNDMPFAGLLLSPFGGFDERELFRIRENGLSGAADAKFNDGKIKAGGGNIKANGAADAKASVGEKNTSDERVAACGEMTNRVWDDGVSDTAADSKETDNANAFRAAQGGEKSLYQMLLDAPDFGDGLSAKAAEFAAWFETWRLRCGYKSVFAFLSGVISDTGYEAAVLSRPGGRRRLDAANRFLKRAETTRLSAHKFLVEYDAAPEDKKGAPPAAKNDDKVTVVTVHASKGLEYEVVFLPCINPGGSKSRGGDALIENGRLSGYAEILGLRYFDSAARVKSDTLSLKAAEILNVRREAREEMRLFYVALTRAKSRLFISGNAFDYGARSSPASVLRDFADVLSAAVYKNHELNAVFKTHSFLYGEDELPTEEYNSAATPAARSAVAVKSNTASVADTASVVNSSTVSTGTALNSTDTALTIGTAVNAALNTVPATEIAPPINHAIANAPAATEGNRFAAREDRPSEALNGALTGEKARSFTDLAAAGGTGVTALSGATYNAIYCNRIETYFKYHYNYKEATTTGAKYSVSALNAEKGGSLYKTEEEDLRHRRGGMSGAEEFSVFLEGLEAFKDGLSSGDTPVIVLDGNAAAYETDKHAFGITDDTAAHTEYKTSASEEERADMEALESFGAREYDEDGEFYYADGAAADAGTAFHAVMQHIDLGITSLDGVKKAVEDMTGAGLISRETAELVNPRDIFRCLNSKIMRYAAANKVKREQPFLLFLPAKEVLNVQVEDKTLIQGVIDLIIFGNKLVVVDFKNSLKNAEKLAETYKRQLYLYKTAVERAFKKKVDLIAFYSVRDGSTIFL
ncbi:MAG: UvrD-helicase domain-containing protein [Clostridiaceae bacterium]|jgi:ATP-dependent helicase/nuclease subunit A|nr:UvrD-helicase domain-containing protein [Clostridiaceae bacterium]